MTLAKISIKQDGGFWLVYDDGKRQLRNGPHGSEREARQALADIGLKPKIETYFS